MGERQLAEVVLGAVDVLPNHDARELVVVRRAALRADRFCAVNPGAGLRLGDRVRSWAQVRETVRTIGPVVATIGVIVPEARSFMPVNVTVTPAMPYSLGGSRSPLSLISK